MDFQIRFFAADGRLAHVKHMRCDSDDEALERLAHERHPHALELWQGDRLVWRFEDRPI